MQKIPSTGICLKHVEIFWNRFQVVKWCQVMSSLRLQNIDLVPWRRCRAAIGRDLKTLQEHLDNRSQKIIPETCIHLFHPFSNCQLLVFYGVFGICDSMLAHVWEVNSFKNCKSFSLSELSKHPTVCGFWYFQPQANLACILIRHYVLHSNNRFHERTDGFSMVFIWVVRAIKDEFKVKKVKKNDGKLPIEILQLASFVLQVRD